MMTAPSTLRSEARKLRFTRSLMAVPLAGLVISVAAATVLVGLMDRDEISQRLSQHGPLRFGPTNVGLLLLIFGIRVVADETHHNTLAATFIATPRRARVLSAKAVIAATTAVALCAAIYAVVLPVTAVVLDARGITMASDVAASAELFARVVVSMVLVTLLGVGFAAAVRNRVIALVAAVAWVALVERAIGGLLRVEDHLPAALVSSLVDGEWSSAPALAAFVVAAFAVAFLSLRRDVV